MKRLIMGLVLGVTVLSLQESEAKEGFVKAWGHRFVMNGSPYYANGFNAYWLMYMASDPSQSYKVSNVFKEASSHGLTVARTWAFSDGGDRPLQFSPGSYNEQTFKGLDFVVSEARKHGIKLILSLVNNYESFGGKKQYVNWGRSKGQYLTSDDDFFTNSLVKGFYKNHVSTVLNRYNSLTGLHYKDDPTIMAWELMNEPRCTSDPSGRTIQGWITEMASHVKSIDRNHMLEAGLEGFYGDSRKTLNPALNIGTDFIANNRIPAIDFATVHCYPDQWLSNSDDQTQMTFLNKWLDSHISDAQRVLRKPLMITEFGKSGYSTWQRDRVFSAVYSKIFASAKNGGVAAGGLFWQLLTEGMETYGDSYAVVLSRNPSTAGIIAQQSRRLIRVRRIFARMRNIQRWKKAKAARRAQNRGKQIGG